MGDQKKPEPNKPRVGRSRRGGPSRADNEARNSPSKPAAHVEGQHVEIDPIDFINELLPDLDPEETPLIAKQPKLGGTFINCKPTNKNFARWQRSQKPVASYYNTSAVTTTDPLRRRKQDCTRMFAVVFDDVETKAKASPVPPSYKMETSPGNFQHGYRIKPERDLELCEYVVRRAAELGYTDKGAGGCNRLVRLPGSANLKPGRENFKSRVTEWNPDRVWDIRDLAKLLGIDISNEALWRSPVVPVNCLAEGNTHVGETDDALLKWLQDNGRVSKDNGEEFVEIICPWSHEHTTGEVSAGYSPQGRGSDKFRDSRAFHCFHEHCSERGINELEKFAIENGWSGGRHSLPSARRFSVKILPELKLTAKGNPKEIQNATIPNVKAGLKAMGLIPRLNMMTKKIDGYDIREVADAFAMVGIKNRSDVEECLLAIALENAFHPMEDWILFEPWDGVMRFEILLTTITLADGEPQGMLRIYLWRFMLQIVECVRGWHDGKLSQKAGVLVFAGPQGAGKSRWFASLLLEAFFREGLSLHLDGYGARDSVVQAVERVLIELGELETTFGKSDAGALKNFLSRSEDTYRKPYARNDETHARTSAYCGTVNNPAVLVDGTGSRRFWGVVVKSLNPDHGINIQQLWAEINVAWEAGQQWWLTDIEEQMRVERAEIFEQGSEVADKLNSLFASDLPPIEEWVPMNISDVAKMLDVPQLAKVRSEIAVWMDQNRGPRRRQIKGIRNSWLMPPNVSWTVTDGRGHLTAVDTTAPDKINSVPRRSRKRPAVDDTTSTEK